MNLPDAARAPLRSVLIWGAVGLCIALPIALAAQSPLLAWRQPIYIAGGFAGIVAMGLMLLQPLLATGALPGLPGSKSRRLHRWVGSAVVLGVVLHVAGLWITSPPDVIDVLLFRSPTPFGIWGMLGMLAVFASAGLALWRIRGRPPLRAWRVAHSALALFIVVATGLHAVLIEGAMEQISKALLSLLLIVATLKALADLKVWKLGKRH